MTAELLSCIAAATPEINPRLEWTKALAPAIAAIIGVIGVGATAYFTFRKGWHDARFGMAGETLKFRLRQIEEFYSPMLVLVEQSRILYEKLKWKISAIEASSPGATGINLNGFRLLDHVYRIENEDALKDLKPLVEKILETGKMISSLIAEKSGLIEGGVTDTYIEYRAHFDLLNASKREPPTSENEGWQEFGYYPRTLNREIREGYKVVLRSLESFYDATDHILGSLLGCIQEPHRIRFQKLRENLSYYENNAESYAEKFDEFDLQEQRLAFLDLIKIRFDDSDCKAWESMSILDAGCGSGRDAESFILAGIPTIAIDISPAMLRLCNRKIRALSERAESTVSEAAKKSKSFELAFDEISYKSHFSGVWAAASLLHVSKSDFMDMLVKLVDAMKPRGVMYFSVKHGFGESQFDARHFSYFTKNEISNMVKTVGGIRIERMWLSDGKNKKISTLCEWRNKITAENSGRYWLNVLVVKG